MKKTVIILSIIILILVLYNAFIVIKPKAIASVGNVRIYQADIVHYTPVYKQLTGDDNPLESSVLLDYLKKAIFRRMCDYYGIDLSRKAINNEPAFSDSNPEYIEMKKIIKGNDFYKYFLLPMASEHILVSFINSDTSGIQKERYNRTLEIDSKWIGNLNVNKLTDEYTDYFIRSREHAQSGFNIDPKQRPDSAENVFSEDNFYYYITREYPDYTEGYRIYKVRPDEHLLTLSEKIEVRFYSEEYMRAIEFVTQGTFWHKLIFKK